MRSVVIVRLYLSTAIVTATALLLFSLAPTPVGAKSPEETLAHWDRPARAIGAEPAGNIKTGPRPYPKDCAACHPAKEADWSGSLHSRSTGPGLMAQLAPHPNEAPGFATACYRCHAPLIEQSEVIETETGFAINPAFDPVLQSTGVSCAACHLRGSVIYGPRKPTNIEADVRGHATAKSALFSSSEFCAACHQLDGGYELNGTVLTNTYNEWKRSRYATSGITCQKCHMPGKRHLWRGIHDPEMVLSGVDIAATYEGNAEDGSLSAKLTITNTGVGHMFPTYVTPSVTVTAFLKDNGGNIIEGSSKSRTIGRSIALDLSEELFDTRIAPDGSFELLYSVDRNIDTTEAKELLFEVTVAPDEFYSRFFASMIENSTPQAGAKKYEMLKEAYKALGLFGPLTGRL